MSPPRRSGASAPRCTRVKCGARRATFSCSDARSAFVERKDERVAARGPRREARPELVLVVSSREADADDVGPTGQVIRQLAHVLIAIRPEPDMPAELAPRGIALASPDRPTPRTRERIAASGDRQQGQRGRTRRARRRRPRRTSARAAASGRARHSASRPPATRAARAPGCRPARASSPRRADGSRCRRRTPSSRRRPWRARSCASSRGRRSARQTAAAASANRIGVTSPS